MPRKIDADTRVAIIRTSIEESPHHLRRVLCHTLLGEVGVKRRSGGNMAALRALLDEYGISADPDPESAELHDWIQLRLKKEVPIPPPLPTGHRPDASWFAQLTAAPLTTEREVETRFASRLFHALGYSDTTEVMGLHLDIYEGVNVKHPEADLVYFANDNHDLKTGNILVLVECKAPNRPVEEAIGQARSYALWLKPMYYVVTNGVLLDAYLFQPGPIPESRVLRTTRQTLSASFDDLYRYLSHDSVVQTKAEAVSAK